MDETRAKELAERFSKLHESGTFVMANVADAGTAAAVAAAGVAAIATTSSGHARTILRDDAVGDVTMEEHAQHTELLVASAEVPCNVDAENGYGHQPEDMAAAVKRFAATGAAGMGIEDWSGDPEIGLYDRTLAVARIEAAVETANGLDRPFLITGRTEILLYGLDGGMAETVARLQEMAAVGAHCLYAPGTWELDSIRTVVDEAGGPVNVLTLVGRSGLAISLSDLTEAGVRRVSVGGSLYDAQVRYGAKLISTTLFEAAPT